MSYTLTRRENSILWRRAACLALVWAAFAAQPAVADEVSFKIEKQPVAAALNQFALQSGREILFSSDIANEEDAQAVDGSYEPEAALAMLLAATNLTYSVTDGEIFLVTNGEQEESDSQQPEDSQAEPAEPEEEEVDDPLTLQTQTVTGTRLAQGDPTARVVTITAEDIAKRGLSSVEDVMRTIPQIFSTLTGTTHMHWPHIGDTINVGSMAVGISTANLRGFGSPNTLVLLNGRRIAGQAGEETFFVNLRHLPAGAIERIEVNLDGGSSVYGSDGIAGIINIITRKGFTGGKATVRNEQSSTGADQSQLSGYFGYNWESGGISTNLSHTESEPYSSRKAGWYTKDWSFLYGGDRRYNFNVSPISGTPYNTRMPGVSSSPWGPFNMILPEGHDGRNAQPEDFRLATEADALEVLPSDSGGATLDKSITLNIEQTFAGRLRLRGEYYRTESETEVRVSNFGPGAFRVPASNAFNNFGQRVYVDYNPQNEVDLGLIPESEQSSSNESDRIIAGFDIDFSENLKLSVDWLNSNSKADSYQYRMTDIVDGPHADSAHTTRVVELFASSDPNEAINPFGDGTGQNPTFAELFGPISTFSEGTEITKTEAYLNGSLFNLPGGAVSFVLGGEIRKEDTADRDVARDGRNSNVVDVGLERPYRKLNAYFGELSVPVFGAGNTRTGFRSLVFIGSVRRDDYTVEGALDFDANFDPILTKTNFAHTSLGYGLRWELTDHFSIRGAYDEGFRAPTVNQLFGGTVWRRPNGLAYDPLLDDWVRVYFEAGSNPGLKPEYSDNLSSGFEWRPGFARGLSIALDYSLIDFQDRITDSYVLGSLLPAEVYGNLPQFFVRDSTGRLLEYYDTYVNISRRQSRTWDLQISWQIDTRRFGFFTPSIYYHFVEDMFDQAAPGSERVREVGTSYGVNKRKIKAQLEWIKDRMTVNLFYDYTPAYLNNANSRVGDQPVESRYTIDLSASYRWDNGLLMRAGGRNIFDADFPFTLSRYGKPFDAARVDIRGRVWFVELSYDF